MPKRIQRKRTKGWRMPEDAIYVGRPGIWGNPFTTDDWPDARLWEPGERPAAARAWLVARYRRFAQFTPLELETIRGKDLVCWCPLGVPCHADVLLDIANSAPEGTD